MVCFPIRASHPSIAAHIFECIRSTLCTVFLFYFSETCNIMLLCWLRGVHILSLSCSVERPETTLTRSNPFSLLLFQNVEKIGSALFSFLNIVVCLRSCACAYKIRWQNTIFRRRFVHGTERNAYVSGSIQLSVASGNTRQSSTKRPSAIPIHSVPVPVPLKLCAHEIYSLMAHKSTVPYASVVLFQLMKMRTNENRQIICAAK